ncbi:hypothetical protein K8T06_04925 [bacterium]|nr:hypothetical protein [bacterium]
MSRISSYLFHMGGDEEPIRLIRNIGRCFLGVALQGVGFLFEDMRAKTTPLEVMNRLISANPQNQQCIRPYIGGAEVNDSSTHRYTRHVIDFGKRTEAEARNWPDLVKIVEEKVKPGRDHNKREIYRCYWWQHGEKRAELWRAIQELDRVVVIARLQPQYCITFLPTGIVYSDALVVIANKTNAAFCALQSHPHEIWARFFGSTLEDRLRYTPSDCFETFPFPENWQTHPLLEQIGKEYYEFRAALMICNDEGLTKTYNRFHNPDERDHDILKLRELHAAMDRAVLDAYGWTDISTDCDFILDYEMDDDEAGSRRKKPWRYRWPDNVRDEVLARLLELNAIRAVQEKKAPKNPDKKKPKRVKKRKNTRYNQEGLFT